MSLISRIFSQCARLNRCLVDDRAHVTVGDSGPHVKRIHLALKAIDESIIAPEELLYQRYGPSTASAVLSYKKKRNIINRQYQSTPDNIVGKMTIASLDKEMHTLQDRDNQPRALFCKSHCCYPPPYVQQISAPQGYVASLEKKFISSGGLIN
jgi:peptidoglycan hydrolase-like protein with peptidoglycan-binding domain